MLSYLYYQAVACAWFSRAFKILPEARWYDVRKNFCNLFCKEFTVSHAPVKATPNFCLGPASADCCTLGLAEASVGLVWMGGELKRSKSLWSG